MKGHRHFKIQEYTSGTVGSGTYGSPAMPHGQHQGHGIRSKKKTSRPWPLKVDHRPSLVNVNNFIYLHNKLCGFV
ncbi:hypothetical protein DAI22_01g180100 [Oryza sativa Japonica Group]|nr:hypothetical protein DAI22_01g180100 [Oryza sativa Japonica Group]